MADAVEAARQDMKQEATDELVGSQGHDVMAFRADRADSLCTGR
jgi:hypothetical protein